ncbi:MAG: serine/threonine protein kinase [Planctomycetes bacterium]|nr:serine/threonine protein kinase [Planctomycetota bacterium]
MKATQDGFDASDKDASGTDDPRLLRAAQQYLNALEAGRKPKRSEFVARFPELSGKLETYLDALDLVHGADPALSVCVAVGDADKPSEEEPLPPEPLGDFRIVRRIGRGGMGTVYEAIQLSLGRRVALKTLPFAAALDANHLQRFKNEARAASQLHHTNIVPVYFVGSERGVHYYAMQLIEGQNLAELIRQLRDEAAAKSPPGSPASEQAPATIPVVAAELSTQRASRSGSYYRTVARLTIQAAEALEHAHELGVIHRDVKPANLLVDGRGNVWVTDFGLAQFHTGAGLTRTGDVLGTLRYMSPEQAGGDSAALDPRTDVYSLGATLYELLTLEPLFHGDDQRGLLRQILQDEPRPPRAVDSSVPAELETIVLKALSKIPTERYATAGEFADDLRRFVDNRPILARRPTLTQRVRKWARRHPSVVVAGVVVLILVSIASIVSAALISSAYERERQRAEEAEVRFQQAKRSVDLIIQVCEEELADQPHMVGLRRRLLDFAMMHYQDFEAQRQGDPEAQAELFAIQSRVRGILAELTLLQGAVRFFILNEPEVEADLRVSSEQRRKLDALAPAWPEIGPRGPGTPDKREQRFLEWARQREEAMLKVLSPEQVTRLDQIALQRKGPTAFMEKDVSDRLQFSADQKAKIQSCLREQFVAYGRKPPPPGGPNDGGSKRDGPKSDWPGDPKRGGYEMKPGPPGQNGPEDCDGFLDSRAKEAMQIILALLTDVQRAEWQRMVGAPFTARAGYRYPPKGKPPRDGP